MKVLVWGAVSRTSCNDSVQISKWEKLRLVAQIARHPRRVKLHHRSRLHLLAFENKAIGYFIHQPANQEQQESPNRKRSVIFVVFLFYSPSYQTENNNDAVVSLSHSS